jgi:SAM-dependent methyltransferase
MLTEYLDHFRASWYDFIHNVDTCKEMPLTSLEVVGENKPFASMYCPTLPKSMGVIFRHLEERHRGTTFIDVGCGKGLTLLVASRYRFQKVMGVEFSRTLHGIAETNLKKYRGARLCRNSEVLLLDAAEFQFPPGPLLIYFFNPFKKPVMERVLSNLAGSLGADARDVTVVFDRMHDRELALHFLQPQIIETILGFSIYSHLQPPSKLSAAQT